ncbi:hypothetical protein [Methylovulum psychrotolerans]|uniref:Uncharacterized protein n=1 Tax=Methylovulum psychrotolerans TaxID=1704499 RepID=A0A2S5CFM3_9GAMM|nr:hypothetical protein [Methylovulum psychrotolerans]POZ49532.1 hypothetical protein AADEFJLK_04700 [Methylovulum psychrotolerans]
MTLTGCGTLFAPRIDDLAFVSASVVNILDHSEIPWLGRERPSLKLLEITFESQANLIAVAADHEFNMTSEIFYCGDGPAKYMGGYFSVYHKGAIITPSTQTRNPLKMEGQQKHSYQIYIKYIQQHADISASGETITPKYDLSQPTEGLCARIHGGNMLGTYFDSNIFTIPKTAL